MCFSPGFSLIYDQRLTFFISSPRVSSTMVQSRMFQPKQSSSLSRIPISWLVKRPPCITSSTTHCPGWQYFRHSLIWTCASLTSSWKKSGVSTTLTGTPNILFTERTVQQKVIGTELASALNSCPSDFAAVRMVFPVSLFPVPASPRIMMLKMFPLVPEKNPVRLARYNFRLVLKSNASFSISDPNKEDKPLVAVGAGCCVDGPVWAGPGKMQTSTNESRYFLSVLHNSRWNNWWTKWLRN